MYVVNGRSFRFSGRRFSSPRREAGHFFVLDDFCFGLREGFLGAWWRKSTARNLAQAMHGGCLGGHNIPVGSLTMMTLFAG